MGTNTGNETLKYENELAVYGNDKANPWDMAKLLKGYLSFLIRKRSIFFQQQLISLDSITRVIKVLSLKFIFNILILISRF